jgi:DNA repair/transcription protein MET18/MMS19
MLKIIFILWCHPFIIITVIILIFTYQSDWQALRGALVGCLALLHRKRTVGSIIIADVKRLLETFLQNVQVQSLAAADRKVYVIIYFCCRDA